MKRFYQKKSVRQKVFYRKNFLPSLIVAVTLWIIFFSIIYFTDPINPLAVILFFTVFFLSCLFTFSLVFANTRRGLLSSIGILAYGILCFFGIGNILNFLLVFGVLLAIEVNFWYLKPK